MRPPHMWVNAGSVLSERKQQKTQEKKYSERKIKKRAAKMQSPHGKKILK